MNNNLCAVWHSASTENTRAVIVPDGCRDLIVKSLDPDEGPQWFVSPLFECAEAINVEKGALYTGFRFKPGVRISESSILSVLKDKAPDQEDVYNLIEDFTHLSSSTDEALSCLSANAASVKQAASQLGVGMRTLQRLVLKETAKSPSYWFQLARVRKAARALTQSKPFIEVADTYGFSDQSHMNREIRRWFKLSPSELAASSSIAAQLDDPGYA
ncbi:AraC family transcriptional regulator [Alteromonadaceae bacterium M269]|nr:AraC family transcriptional regulator [Alteromonadaceae bacterium M269]